MHAGIYPRSRHVAVYVLLYVLLYHHVHVALCKCVFINSCCACSGLIVLQCTGASAACEKREKSVDEWKVDVGERKRRKRDVGLMSFGLGFGLVGWTCSFILVWADVFVCSVLCACVLAGSMAINPEPQVPIGEDLSEHVIQPPSLLMGLIRHPQGGR